MAFSITTNSLAYKAGQSENKWSQVSQQVVTDLTTAGITIGASLSGSVPLALTAGYIAKYVTTYGISGMRSLIDQLKGYPPQDLGEINLAYVYLLSVKRNLFGLLMNMRKQAKSYPAGSTLATQLEDLHKDLINDFDKAGPSALLLDEQYVNKVFLDIAIDAKANIDIAQYLKEEELKHTYQYLMLLYFDIVMLEQQLIMTQNNVLVAQVKNAFEIISENPYLSNEEKEYQLQIATNILLRSQLMMDKRKIMVSKSLIKPMLDLQSTNDDLDKEIDSYYDGRK